MALTASGTPTIISMLGRATTWAITGYTADAQTAIEIKAAPGAGRSLYLTAILITCNDADANPQLQDGDATLLFGPVFPSTSGIVVPMRFPDPIKLATNKALQLKAAAGGNVSVWVEGYTAQDNKA